MDFNSKQIVVIVLIIVSAVAFLGWFNSNNCKPVVQVVSGCPNIPTSVPGTSPQAQCLADCDRVCDEMYKNCDPQDEKCIGQCYQQKAQCYLGCLQ